MALLYITEFAEMQIYQGRVGQAVMQPPVAEQAVTMSGSSAQSAAFNAKTRIVRLHTDGIVAISFGTNPTAIVAGTTGTMRMALGQTEYFGVPVGQSFKVAGITST